MTPRSVTARALFALALWSAAPAGAADDDEFLDPAGASEEAADAADRSTWSWPDEARFNTSANTVTLIWDRESAPEVLEFDDIIRVERAQAYESSPEELFLRVADGRRILFSRGADAATHAVLTKALTGFRLEVMPPGQGHFDTRNGAKSSSPRVRIGPGDGVIYRRAQATDLALRGDRGGELRVVAEDDHAALRGEGGGTLAKEQIDLVIKERMALYSRCYEKELRRDAQLAGKVVIRFVVDKDGSVKHAHLRATSMNNSVVESCVTSEVLQTRFPRPNGGTVVVSYPFSFQPR
jgi:hypothetical protein